jgi:hypothetical protein
VPDPLPDLDEAAALAEAFVAGTAEPVFLTGKAGTGKTTFLKRIRSATGKATAVAAPTGVAAINAGGVTLHSLFQLPLGPYVPGFKQQENERTKMRKAKLDLLRQMELLIIDEVSMLRADTLDAIDDRLRRVRGSDVPFGGVQMLYIGDLFQLPPVVKDDEMALLRPHYASPFFFDAQVARRAPPVVIELKTVYRQSEARFISLLNAVRNNRLTAEDFGLLNARVRPDFIPPPDEHYITLTTHNAKADAINLGELRRLDAPERVYAAVLEGDFPESALPNERELRLKVGAQVMFIRNDPQGRYFNGKIGTVSGFAAECVIVTDPERAEAIDVPLEKWDNIRYTLNKATGVMDEEKIGSFTQFPLRLAWAVTIHKSQGLTFRRAVIDAGAAFASGQVYVALSRCTTLDGIVLRAPVSPHCVMTNPLAVRFTAGERPAGELRDALAEASRLFWRARLPRAFAFKPVFVALGEFERALKDNASEAFERMRVLLDGFRRAAHELEAVATQFKPQLERLVLEAERTGDAAALRGRCVKAVAYFQEQVKDRILLPLIGEANASDAPRAAALRRTIAGFRDDIVLFLDTMRRVRFNGQPVLLDGDVPKLALPDLAGSERRARGDWAKGTPGRPRKQAQTKGESALATYALFREGLTVAEIAARRELSLGTIESHLCERIKAGDEVPVEKLFTPDEWETVSAAAKPILALPVPSLKPVYERLGGAFSYGQLRMVFALLKRRAES